MFRRLSLGAKIAAALCVPISLGVGVGAVALYGQSTNEVLVRDLSERALPAIDALTRIDTALVRIGMLQRDLMIPGLGREHRERQYAILGQCREAYQAAIKDFEAVAPDVAASSTWSEFRTVLQAWRDANNKFFPVCKAVDETAIFDPAALEAEYQRLAHEQHELDLMLVEAVHSGAAPAADAAAHLAALDAWLALPPHDNPAIAKIVDEWRPIAKEIAAAFEAIRTSLERGERDEAQAARDARYSPASLAVAEMIERLIALAAESRKQFVEARTLGLESCAPLRDRTGEVLARLVRETHESAQARGRAAVATSNMLSNVNIAAVATLVGLSSVLGFLVTRAIARPILRIVRQLGDGSALVAEASEHVNASTAQLASASTEQAASLEQTNRALEEMTKSTQANADNAREASGLVESVRGDAQASDQALARLNTAMAAINESSQQISRIIKVIEEIAFQTNLLALNAAVEAARAGEHGKGFAVVAEEVRGLAKRAADAARETTTLIEQSVSRAQEGGDVAADFGAALSSIVASVGRTAELVRNIDSASAFQAKGVTEIGQSVGQMDQVTQSISSSSEESAAAVEELSAQAASVAETANDLAHIVGARITSVDRERAHAVIERNIRDRRQSIRRDKR